MKRLLPSFLLFFITLVLVASGASGGVGDWTPIGLPQAGPVWFLAASPTYPSTIFAALKAGPLFRSSDGGMTWEALGVNLASFFSPETLIFDPAAPSVLYVASSGGLVKSTDNGTTFALASNGLPVTPFSLAIDPGPSRTLFAMTDQGLFKSNDAASTWARIGSGLPTQFCCGDMLLAPTSPPTLYTITLGRSLLYRSANGGESWSPGSRPPGFFLFLAAVDPFLPQVVYTSYVEPTRSACNVGGLSRSGDGGASWTAIGGASSGFVPDLAVHPGAPGVLYGFGCGIFRSTDRGDSWTNVFDDQGQVYSVAIDPFTSTVYASTEKSGFIKRTFSDATLCPGGTRTLCLGPAPYRVEVSWRTPSGLTGSGQATPITTNTGAFWFFDPTNLELVVKVLDGRSVNGKWWVFYGALTNVEYTLTVTDTQTGAVKTYLNPQGQLASVADTSAF